ncbi:shootin-1 [Chelonus insularis]|uniref:shootin-1 n=1 Tax=Chelonus insularis TaxID=460826 RepID=UPI00158EBBC1|nr:shootin-1 [Chelonus insularis]XP_034940116.1 shootin-1 [Chelonus insularis]XP_034940125.1 shootin-1 [Chelonus insularis]
MHRSELTCNISSPEIGRVKTPTMTNHSHIPVPKSFITPNKSTLHSLTKRGNLSTSIDKNSPSPTLQGRITSVAAHKASFEKLDAAAAATNLQKRTFNDNSIVSNFQSKFQDNGRQSPVRKTFSPSNSFKLNGTNNNTVTSLDVNWKLKYEDSEKKRKILLQKSEIVHKEHTDLEKRHQQLVRENSTLQSQVRDKDEQLQKLRTVSEAVCKEYEQLKRQYDVETGAMHKAMQQASQWYKQNRQLKRRSQVLAQKILESRPDAMADDSYLSDEVDANEADDAEELRQTISELSAEVARLQTELNSARLQEFEAQEQAALTNARLEDEKEMREKGEEIIKQLTIHKENMERVSRMVADEVQALKVQCDRERENAKIMKMEADRMQKERNVLAHQSALLMAEVSDDPNGRLLTVLQEVESLKLLLEEEKQEHLEQIQLLQDKLEEKESNVEFEIVEEKLKLAEVELNMMQERAERAEKEVQRLEEIVRKLEEKICEIEKKSTPPPPPLPPPPPPLPQSSSISASSVKLLTRERQQHDQNRNSAIVDMENMLGISKKPPAVPQQPAIDDIINQIKGGRFTLKQTDKQREEERRRKREMESAPAAVSEMLNILGTMRRRAKPVRQSLNFPDMSTQLN